MGMAYSGDGEPKIKWQWRRLPKLRRWLLDDDDKFIALVSLRPTWGQYGMEWPCMRVDKSGFGRMIVTPVWDRGRLLAPFRDMKK